jgi:hypothetical protein
VILISRIFRLSKEEASAAEERPLASTQKIGAILISRIFRLSKEGASAAEERPLSSTQKNRRNTHLTHFRPSKKSFNR